MLIQQQEETCASPSPRPSIAAAAATAGCGHARGEDGGPTVSRNYQVGDFQQIEVAGPYDVEVRTGAQAQRLGARVAKSCSSKTVVEVKGDKLVIHPEEQHGLFHFGWSTHGKASFVVTVPQLSGATIAGSGDIKVDKVQGDTFEGEVAGSGGLNVAALDVQR